MADWYVVIAQFGLGCYERWVAGEGEDWFQTALGAGRYLLAEQQADGSWLHPQPFPHSFPVRVPWRCGMAQGEAASLLVRLFLETGEEVFKESALRALGPLSRPVEQDGVCAQLNGAPWPEEFPTDRGSFVLNGAIFAWWGIRDVAVGLDNEPARQRFEAGVDALAASIHRFDTGYWSLYCLRRYPLPAIASSFYHALHITQLEAMQRLAPRPEFDVTRARWLEYFASSPLRCRAFLQKVLFRLVVPRNRLLARPMLRLWGQ